MDDVKLAMLGSKEAAKRLTDAGVLVSCPFCGGTEINSCYVLGDFWFQCKKCGCGCGFHSSEKMARKAWNTRAPILSSEEMEMLNERSL